MSLVSVPKLPVLVNLLICVQLTVVLFAEVCVALHVTEYVDQCHVITLGQSVQVSQAMHVTGW